MRALINVILPKAEEQDKQFIGVNEFRNILQEMGLRPSDMPSYNTPEDEAKVRDYCLHRAASIFLRMPENTEDEKDRKERSVANIIYASDLAASNTLFMVTTHTQSEYRFRLLNPRIEELQAGCKDLVLRVQKYNKGNSEKQITIEGEIKIFEHGLEESTISGTIVKSRRKTGTKIAERDVIIAIVGFTLFIVLTALNLSSLITNPTLHTLIDRLSTAMFTATIVSAITVYYTIARVTPLIQWTASYDRK